MIDRLYKVYTFNGRLVAREHKVKECKTIFKIDNGYGYEQLQKIELNSIRETHFANRHIWCVREDILEMAERLKTEKLRILTEEIRELQDEQRALQEGRLGYIKLEEEPSPRIKITDDML